MKKLLFYIGGDWVPSANGEWAPVFSPSTGAVIAETAMGSSEDVERAVAAAEHAKASFARLPLMERARLLHAIADALAADLDDIAHDLALEQGKPFQTEARREVQAAIKMWHDSAEDCKRIQGEVLPSTDPAKRILTFHQPRGIYAVITPWNFPLTVPTEHLCAALAAGNTVVWKPSEYTPLTAYNMLRCAEQAGLPPGVLNCVVGLGSAVGAPLVSHSQVNGVALTGSSETGERVARAAGAKAMLLELGGNGPTIIFDDADVETAIARTAYGCWANAGQICDSTERILVQRSVHERVVAGLVKSAKEVRLGLSLESETTMGPLNNQPVADKVDRHVQDALAKGADILTGGRRAAGFDTPLFYEPTVIDRVTPDMLLNQEETFGPVAPVLVFDDDDEALALANNCRLGLAAGVFTSNVARAFYLTEQLEMGVVNINETCAYWQSHTPFGGYSGKRSGLGRLGGKYGILEMSQIKTMVIDLKNAAGGSRCYSP